VISVNNLVFLICVCGFFVLPASAQVDQFCEEFGYRPILDAPHLSAPYVYGRVVIKADAPVARFPKVTITYSNRSQSPTRQTITNSGNYCFPVTSGNGGILVIEIEGVEVTRRQVADFGPAQKREDFDVTVPGPNRSIAPSAVSSKFYYPPNERTVPLYSKAAEAEKRKAYSEAISFVKDIVAKDPEDFLGWEYLGTLYFNERLYSEADAAYRKSLTLRINYPRAWVNVGKLRVAQKNFGGAIEIFKHAISLEPEVALTYRLLGEAYLQNKQGSLGEQALKEALRLDPVAMAECHLVLAHLYQLAGAKPLAAVEYKVLLEKVPNHPERKKFEKFIKENPSPGN
jgi:cytochrome c-type biogenesis protein CcmH/NrfG